MLPETVRLTQQAKDQLLRVKRRTGLKNWNVLCRWALCASLSDGDVSGRRPDPADSNVEMTWRTFAGRHEPAFRAILLHESRRLGVAPDVALQIHLQRGIAKLADYPDLASLVARATVGSDEGQPVRAAG